MQQLFTHLSRAVEGAPWIALGAAATWGILSIILSPCHLASIPVLAGTSTEVVERFLKWNQGSKCLVILKGVCGVLVLPGGLWMVHIAR